MKKAAARSGLYVAALMAMAPVQACGLEPAINGGFTVSHPRSIDVAVAVANARRTGLLPPAKTDAVDKDGRLRALISDLQRLQGRLSNGVRNSAADSTDPFSLVLVGPGLWSHFHSNPDAVLARYHVDGPLAGRAVVLTHAAVLNALLGGELSVDQAMADGLLSFSGSNTEQLRGVFVTSLAPRG